MRLIETDPGCALLSLLLNWLQVSRFTKLSEIDERESDQLDPSMTILLGLKA
jgi:hypothetical protein